MYRGTLLKCEVPSAVTARKACNNHSYNFVISLRVQSCTTAWYFTLLVAVQNGTQRKHLSPFFNFRNRSEHLHEEDDTS